MKLIYLTAKNVPGFTANHVHVRELSCQLAKLCDYTLVIGGSNHSPEALAVELPGVTVINRHLGGSRGRTLDYFFWFRSFARTLGPDTIILSNDANLLVVAIFWRLLLRKKYQIVSYWHMFFKPWQNAIVGRGSNAALSLTSHLAALLEQRYKNLRHKILVSPDAVNTEIFDISLSKADARQKLNLPLNANILLYTGRFKTLDMDKGIGDILKALALIQTRVLFVAVGGRPEDIAEYQSLATHLQVAEKVRLIGFVSQAELATYQKAADVLMMYFPWNDHYAYYMSPMKMFEYMMAERPIIASDLPAIREILSEKEAFIVPPGDPQMLAESIVNVLTTPEEAEKRAKASYAHGREYTWEEKAKNISSFLKSIL